MADQPTPPAPPASTGLRPAIMAPKKIRRPGRKRARRKTRTPFLHAHPLARHGLKGHK